jgi:hypothetical protein
MVAASFGFTWFMRLFLCLIQPSRQLFYSPSFNEKSSQDRYGVPRIFGFNFSGFLAWWLADRLLGLPKAKNQRRRFATLILQTAA